MGCNQESLGRSSRGDRHMTTHRVTLIAWIIGLVGAVGWIASPPAAQSRTAERLDAAIRSAGIQIRGVSIGTEMDKSTWRVHPPSRQAEAQPIIDAFDPTDPVHEQADLDRQVRAALDNERLSSAMIWTILKQMYPA